MQGSLVNYDSYPVHNSCRDNMERRWRTMKTWRNRRGGGGRMLVLLLWFSLCLTRICWRQLLGGAKANEVVVVFESVL